MRAWTFSAIAVPAMLASAVLTGCSAGVGASATPTPAATPPIAPGTEVVPTAAPVLRPGGTAEQNKLYWDATIATYWGQFGLGSTQTMVDLMYGAGFDASILELTYDATAIGLAVDSIEVSARFGDECLIADVRADRYNTAIMPVLGTGKCLVGETHPLG